MLTRGQANVLFFVLVALCMSGIMSMAFTILNTYTLHQSLEGFVLRWLRGWGIAFLIATPSVLVIVPRVRRFTDAMVRR